MSLKQLFEPVEKISFNAFVNSVNMVEGTKTLTLAADPDLDVAADDVTLFLPAPPTGGVFEIAVLPAGQPSVLAPFFFLTGIPVVPVGGAVFTLASEVFQGHVMGNICMISFFLALTTVTSVAFNSVGMEIDFSAVFPTIPNSTIATGIVRGQVSGGGGAWTEQNDNSAFNAGQVLPIDLFFNAPLAAEAIITVQGNMAFKVSP